MVVRVHLTPANDGRKKWKATVRVGTRAPCTVKFGQYGASDFTKHKDVLRMYKYVRRHHALDMPRLKKDEGSYTAKQLAALQSRLDRVDTSSRERWGIDGVCTAGFWSRWLTWSRPTLAKAKQFMSETFGIVFETTQKPSKSPRRAPSRRKRPSKKKKP